MGDLFGTRRSPLVGFILAPLAPLLVLAIIAMASTGQIPGLSWGAVLILPISYITSLIIGGPIAYILILLKKVRLWHYALAGILASAAPIFVVLIYPIVILNDPAPPDLGWMPGHTGIALLMASAGLIVGVVFWAVTRPDLPRAS